MKNQYNLKTSAFAISIIALSLSIILGYVEALVPINIGVVGIKLGLSNIITIICLKILNVRTTLLINILRISIIGILFSNLTRFLISISGFLLSFIALLFTLKLLKFNIVLSSIFGGIFHNIGQILIVSIIIANISIYNLLYLFIIFGAISGFIIGIISDICYKKVYKVVFE